MRKSLGCLFLALFAFCVLTGCSEQPSATPAENSGTSTQTQDLLKRSAQQLVDDLAAGNFAAVVSHFDATMQEQLPAQTLQQVWASLGEQAGSYVSRQQASVEQLQSGLIAVYVPCTFEHTNLEAKVVYDADGKVSGLFFQPARTAIATPQADEQTFLVSSGQYILPGTLTLPEGEGPFPAVVLVQGSGPSDRNESVGNTAPFRDIAHGLAQHGIASLRYDKRTFVYSEAMSKQQDLTVWDETIDDAIAAARQLSAVQAIQKDAIFVAGHSIGATLIPRIAASGADIRGYILLAPAARPLQKAILEQSVYILEKQAGVSEQQKQQQLQSLQQAVERIDSLTVDSQYSPQQLLGAPASYWLDLQGYDPCKEIQEIRQPIMILRGNRDYQVTRQEFDAYVQALSQKENLTAIEYPSLNHLFIAGEGLSTPQEYMEGGQVDAKVIGDMAEFVLQNID